MELYNICWLDWKDTQEYWQPILVHTYQHLPPQWSTAGSTDRSTWKIPLWAQSTLPAIYELAVIADG
jgi:hypothetical protein